MATSPDTLVLVFTPGVSLRMWRETGMLSREWALYERLAPRYRRVVLATFGDAGEAAELEPVASPDVLAKTTIVCNRDGRSAVEFERELPGLVAEAVAGSGGVVVKTNQMVAGLLGVRVAQAIRSTGVTTALVARGGYLWTRFVAYEHGPHSPQALAAERAERELCTAADMVMGTTAEMVDDLAWRYGLDPSRAVVVPNYVITDHADTTLEREPGLVLYAGQLVARKRVDLLIRAVAMLHQAGTTVRLEVMGDGPEQRRLVALAAELDAPVCFEPRRPHDHLLERMRRCMVYAQASELEGHPKTVIEAMSCGAAVLVANSAGLAGVITHGSTGLRVDPDPAAIAHAIDELLSDSEWRESLGAAAGRTARAAYGLGGIAEREYGVHLAAFERAQSGGRLPCTA